MSSEDFSDGDQSFEESQVYEKTGPGMATMARGAAAPARGTQRVTNQHFDEAMNVSSDEGRSQDDAESADGDLDAGRGPRAAASASPGGVYNPQDYMNMNVSDEIRELFQYITRFKPQDIELETTLKPFIPDYIPAVGELDAFIKIPRPDGQPDPLGLTVLDEPATHQSDRVVLDLHLRSITKHAGLQPVAVSSIEGAERNPKAVQQWITSIEELRRTRPPASFVPSRPLPSLDSLMQEWAPEFEAALAQMQLPPASLDVDAATYARIVCALLDIPVYSNVIESLHHLFELYMEFCNNPHFNAPGREAAPAEGAAQTLQL